MARGMSLHIGLNAVDPDQYCGWRGVLHACEADALTMQQICRSRGFETNVLQTSAATRSAVLGALDRAAQELSHGDILVLSYSGHGGQVPDENSDEDDGLDETWCLFDGQLIDDELYSAWAKFDGGVRIAVFSDSCHSGTVVKEMLLSLSRGRYAFEPAAEAIPKAMPLDVQWRTYMEHKEQYEELLSQKAPPTPSCSVVLISGCQDNQTSQDGAFNGAFTGALLHVWANGSFKGGYDEFAKKVRSALPPTQSPNLMTVGAPADQFIRQQVFTI
jgi:hypothetical protein